MNSPYCLSDLVVSFVDTLEILSDEHLVGIGRLVPAESAMGLFSLYEWSPGLHFGNVGRLGNSFFRVACYVFGLLPGLILLCPILYFVLVVPDMADLVQRAEPSFFWYFFATGISAWSWIIFWKLLDSRIVSNLSATLVSIRIRKDTLSLLESSLYTLE